MAYLSLIHIRQCKITYVENPEVTVWVVLLTIFLEVNATNQDTVIFKNKQFSKVIKLEKFG